MRVRVECYDRSRPVIRITRSVPYVTVDSESETEDDPKDINYEPLEGEEEEDDDEYDPDEEQISDSEDGSDYEEEEEEEQEDETIREPKPYYGKGYTIVFDSVEDKKEYFKNLSRKE